MEDLFVTTNCAINAFASPRVIDFGREVDIGKTGVPSRSMLRRTGVLCTLCRRVNHASVNPLARFRMIATVVFSCFKARPYSIMLLRINLNNLCSDAGITRPSFSLVAAVNGSRDGVLKSAVTRVTCRGTKVVGRKAPIIVKELPRRTFTIVHSATRGGTTPLRTFNPSFDISG